MAFEMLGRLNVELKLGSVLLLCWLGDCREWANWDGNDGAEVVIGVRLEETLLEMLKVLFGVGKGGVRWIGDGWLE